MDVLLMGPPGAGKGTQGALLSRHLGIPKLATGDLLRDAVRDGTPLGRKAKEVMEAGHLVGDDIILAVVNEELRKPAAAKGVIFDGVVRTIPQAEGMERMLSELGRRIDAVLFFDDATARETTELLAGEGGASPPLFQAAGGGREGIVSLGRTDLFGELRRRLGE